MNLEFVTKSTTRKVSFSSPVVKINPNNNNIMLSKTVMAKLREDLGADEVKIGFAFDAESAYVGIYLAPEQGLKLSKSGSIANGGLVQRIQEVLSVDLGAMVGEFDVNIDAPLNNEQVGNIYPLSFSKTVEPRKRSSTTTTEPKVEAVPEVVADVEDIPQQDIPEEVTSMMPEESTIAELEGDQPTNIEDLATANEDSSDDGDDWPA